MPVTSLNPDANVANRAALGARAAWNRELRAGRRTTATHDWLSRAACAEAVAAEYERDARSCLAHAERATTASDCVRYAACALVFANAADSYLDRAAELVTAAPTADAASEAP